MENIINFPKPGVPPKVIELSQMVLGHDKFLFASYIDNNLHLYVGSELTPMEIKFIHVQMEQVERLRQPLDPAHRRGFGAPTKDDASLD